MNINPAIKWLVPIILLLAFIASFAGLWYGEGHSFSETTPRGEAITINARGLYYWDTVSTTAQMQANDLVTMVLGLPLLAVSFWLTMRGSLRWKITLTGTLGFFLYTYMSMCFGTAYNPFFLVYVALFTASLYAFILAMLSFDLKTLPEHFSNKLPRGWIAGLLIFAGAFLAIAWLGLVAGTFKPGAIPALENTTTMFIQAMDLALIVPLCILSGILLLKRSAWGYLLASVGMLKFVTMGSAVSLMAINMARIGVQISPVQLVIFPLITLTNFIIVIVLLRNIREARSNH